MASDIILWATFKTNYDYLKNRPFPSDDARRLEAIRLTEKAHPQGNAGRAWQPRRKARAA